MTSMFTFPPGSVVLVGGGPGDPGLMTVKGLSAIRQADVILYDRLAPLACLLEARADVELVDVGKIPHQCRSSQDYINSLLITHALAGRLVVRLKGGDPFVFGRGAEEWLACASAGVAVQVVPGVTSAIGAPSLGGIPVTHRGLTQGFTVLSGHVAPDDPRCTINWEAAAGTGTTLVILMAVEHLPQICARLLGGGMDGSTPAAMIRCGGTPSQKTVRSTLAHLCEDAADAGVEPPAVTVIGAVAGLDLPDLVGARLG